MIDLHTHSTFSDGSETPTRLIQLAAEAGCSAIALTDHDTLQGVPEATIEADRLGIELVAGVELSCHTAGRNVHLLGYFLNSENLQLQERLETQRGLRNERNERLARRLSDLGYNITLDEVLHQAGAGSVGRPHFAAVLVKRGYASSVNNAFERYLAEGGPAYVERQELPAEDGIRWIHEAGGVCSWAHPVWKERFPVEAVEPVLVQLIEAGLDGLEARYSRYDGDTRRRLTRLAERHGVIATGGSDYHGSYKPDLQVGTGVGDLCVPAEVIDQLRAKISG